MTGMEYPGMTFNDYREKKAGLWFLISHEIGHSWYPMIVGSMNENTCGWMKASILLSTRTPLIFSIKANTQKILYFPKLTFSLISI